MSDQPRAAEGDPPLILATVLQNPRLFNAAQVAVTTDASVPVLNTLELLIHNPSDNPVVELENPDGLTPDDPLPPIEGGYVGPRLDRLYVYFPYGSTHGTLTTRKLAVAFTLSPAPDNVSWDVSPMSDPDIGPYWLLFPRSQVVLQPNESVRFVITGIQTFNPQGSLTHLNLKKQITGYAVETSRGTNLSLIDAPPQIDSFQASAQKVDAGTTVDLSWATWNAKTVTLDPGNLQGLPPGEDAYPQRLLGTTNFRLQAVSPSGKTTQEFQPVEVNPAVAESFAAQPPEGSRIGEPVTLTWRVDSAVTVDVQPGIGKVCEDADGCDTGQWVVHPTVRTVYTLTARGENNQDSLTVTVFPLPVGWLQTSGSAPWNTRDRPVLLAFQEKLFFLAGGTASITNDIYSSLDGATWAVVNQAAPWELRGYAGGVTFGSENPRMWLMGGEGKDGACFNDVWATDQADGTGWVQVSSEAPWSARSSHAMVVFQGKMWIVGGRGPSGGLQDVWSSADGETWEQVTEKAPWSPRWGVGLAVFSDRLWLFGGQTGPQPYQVSDEVWASSDGVTWERKPTPPWGSRSYANAQPSGPALYLFGGVFSETVAADDLWEMTLREEDDKEIIQWQQLSTRPQGNSGALASTQMAGGIWLAGGWSAPQNVRGPNKRVFLYGATDPSDPSERFIPTVKKQRGDETMDGSYEYDGILVRASLEDEGTIPRTGALQESPDVSPQGKSAVGNPPSFFKRTWGENVAQPVVAEQRNLIYVRGNNLGMEPQDGTITVYWSREGDLDDPEIWKRNQLLTTAGEGEEDMGLVQQADIGVGSTPFTWTPDISLVGESIVFIGVVATNEHPDPVPRLRSPIDFDRWISREGGIGAFQTTIERPPEPVATVKTSGQYDLGNTAGVVSFYLRATNFPAGSTVSFKAAELDANGNPIELKPTKIQTSPSVHIVDATVPANFKTELTFELILPEGELAGADNSLMVYAGQYEDQAGDAAGSSRTFAPEEDLRAAGARASKFVIQGQYTTQIKVPVA